MENLEDLDIMTNRTLQRSVKEKEIERGYRRRDRKMDFQIAKGNS